MKLKINFQGGQAMMVATMFFLVISLTIIFGLAGPIVRQQKMVSQFLLSRQSYFLAEAGVEDVAYRLMVGMPVGATETLTLNGSSVTTATAETVGGKTITATGEVNKAVRKIRTLLSIGTGITFHYGIQVGNGGFTLSNNAGVNGNVYSNADIMGQNGSFITGDAYAAGTVSGVAVSGEMRNNQNIQALPIPDEQIANWKTEASVGGSVGNQTFSGSGNILGPKKIAGNLTLSNNASLTVTGTLWITGDLVLSNNAEVKLASSYGVNDGIVIVDGVTTLNNDSIFRGSGTDESYIMILSTNTGSNAISLQNNAGAAILYAPYGTVQISNNAGLNQVTAKTVSLQNNAVIDYVSGLVDASFTSGPSGGYEIADWQEIE